MNASLVRQHKYLLLIGLLLFWVTDIALAGYFNKGVILNHYDHTFTWGDADFDGIRNDVDPDDDNDGFLDYEDAFPLDPKRSKSFVYCGINMIMMCNRNGMCRDRHFPDPRCLKSTKEPDVSKLRLMGFDTNRDGIRDDIEIKIDAKFTGIVRTHTREMAKNYQKILSGTLSHKQINRQITEIEHLDSCIRDAGSKNDDMGLRFITYRQLSTVDRTRTYLQRAAEAYDAEGPPTVKDCGNAKKNSSRKNLLMASTKGGGMARGSSKSNSKDLKDYDIYFINGVMNNEGDAKKSRNKLQKILNKDFKEPLYNKNHLLSQFFDVYVEKTGEERIDKTGTGGFWRFIYEVSPPVGQIALALPQWLDPERDIGYWADKDLKRMIALTKESLENKKKVIVVPHSEGNFFYRKIHQALDKWDSKKTQQCFAGIGFATPLSSKPGNYKYITNHYDKVINVVRNFWNSTLAANVRVPKGYNGDGSGHGMQATYLSHSIPVDRFKSEFNQAVDKLDKSCDTKKCADPVGKRGGQGEYKYTYALKDTSAHTVEISFEAYSVPDQIRITANGKTIAQTDGYVSGFHQWQINYDPKKHGTEFIAHVDAQNNGTAWNLCIDCEGSSCGGQIQRKKVSYSFKGTDSHQRWTCSNYRIDGSTVDQSGTKMLSVGEHRFSADCSCKWGTPPGLCKPFFGFPYVDVSWSSSASCGTREECGLNNKRNVMVDVY